MVRDARYSGDTYAIERPDRSREVLFGVSVFAIQRLDDVRFPLRALARV